MRKSPSPPSSLDSTTNTELDSDLQLDTNNSVVPFSPSQENLNITRKSQLSDEDSPDQFIGGANVVHSSESRPSLNVHKSIFEDDQDEESSDQENTTLDNARPTTTDNSNNTYSSSFEHRNPQKHINQNETTHKIFTFSLPFGGNSIHPTSTLSSLVTSILPGDSEHKSSTPDRHKIKEKLKRSDSITSLEEMALFSDTKGIDNVRVRAFKKTFEMESLKQALKNITSSPGEYTHDGYEYSRLETIWNEIDGDFLIMGGYRGSILRDSLTHRRIWIPIRAGLNFRKVDLLIGPKDEDEIETQKKIKPDGMLTHIGPVDISKRLIRKLRSNPKVKVENFGYDWRLSLDISADHLRDKLQEIYDKQITKKGTYIIAHSMGGLVAHKVLQEHTHLIRGLIYVGAPSECSNILGPLKFGDEVLMNKTILSKEANFFMRSSFYFLPTDGTCFVDKHTYKKYKLDFFDPKIWVKLALSPVVDEDRKIRIEQLEKEHSKSAKEEEKKMAKTESREKQPQPGISTDVKDLLGMLNPVPMLKSLSGHQTPPNSSSVTSEISDTLKIFNPAPLLTKISSTATDSMGLTESKQCQEDEEELTFVTPYDDCIDYLKRTLKRAKEFLTSLDYIKDKTYPPLVIVYGNTVPTVRGVKINGLKDIKLGNYDDFYYGPGDGVVHHKWLLPEQRGFPVAAKIESDCGHVSLLSDLESMAKAFISIVDKEKRESKAD